MWDFVELQKRIMRLWGVYANEKYSRLAEIVERGWVDDVLEGIGDPEDDYATCLEKLREAIKSNRQFLDLVDKHLKLAIQELRWIPPTEE